MIPRALILGIVVASAAFSATALVAKQSSAQGDAGAEDAGAPREKLEGA